MALEPKGITIKPKEPYDQMFVALDRREVIFQIQGPFDWQPPLGTTRISFSEFDRLMTFLLTIQTQIHERTTAKP